MPKEKKYIINNVIIRNFALRKSKKIISKIKFYEDQENEEESIELQIFLNHFKNHLKQEQRHFCKKKV
jgi:hypothetical protein